MSGNGFLFGNEEPSEANSTLIKSGSGLSFTVKFEIPKKSDLKKGLLQKHYPMGQGKILFHILHEATERTKDVKFSIRMSL